MQQAGQSCIQHDIDGHRTEKINTNAEVLTEAGEAIPGLYAAGEVVGGVMGDDSPAGANVGWALTSGRVAADAIAEAIKAGK